MAQPTTPRQWPLANRESSRFLSSAGSQIDEISARLSRRARADSATEAPAPRLSFWRPKASTLLGPRLDYSITAAEESAPKATAGSKLGTFEGVFMPTTLNVLSILMFLRFSFIVGQTGFLGTLGLLLISYALNLLTVLSISAISTNGTVRGGGAYYMISRCLGPEFGGSIGIVFYIGQVLNAGMNIVGFVEPLMNNYGKKNGEIAHILPESFWFTFLYGSVLCLICTVVCTAGSKFFARVSFVIFVLLGISTLSIPLSALFLAPFETREITWHPSFSTFSNNMLPRFTKGAAGSQIFQKENFRTIFGLLFPATAGIFAGSADSGKLQNPSKSIPKGTLQGLGLTLVLYTLVVLVLSFGVERRYLYTDLNALQDINASKYLILLGSLSTATFSALCGINGAAKMLQAIARDDSLPILNVFKYGTKSTDEPLLAIAITYILTQCVLFADINQIASFVTMTFLLTFAGINLACFLLDISSAPNFRPSFTYYSWHTALIGFLVSFVIMFFVDGVYAAVAFPFLGVLFIMVHYFGAPKNYGDISQALIYHQVRKFLLRLDKGKEHVKFWRPQILLLVNDARRNLKLIHFCNSLKKSGLYVLGHVMITEDFSEDLPELKRQQNAWHRLVEVIKVKAFIQVGVAKTEVWGAMNLCLSSGLGGMRPNLVIMSFFNLAERRLIDHPSQQGPEETRVVGDALLRAEELAWQRKRQREDEVDREKNYLPTDSCRKNPAISVCTYLNIVEDIIASFNLNIALAKGFSQLEEPETTTKEFLDLWPIQMSPSTDQSGDASILSTNFDTYTMILQMGQILHTVPKWRKAYKLRVLVFVEHKADIPEERRRVSLLLENLRIDAQLVVLSMDAGNLPSYEILVNGREATDEIDKALRSEVWWTERHERESQAHHRTDSRHGRQHRGSASSNMAIRKRRQSTGLPPMSAPLSFRTNVPMPPHDDTTDSEEETDSDDLQESDFIMPRYRDAAVFDDDEEATTGFNSRRASGHPDTPPDFTASLLPPRTQIIKGEVPVNEPSNLDSEQSRDTQGSESDHDDQSEAGQDEQEGTKPTISFAPPPANHPNATSQAMRPSFNEIPAKAQHLIINELIKSQSQHTGVLFTTLPPPPEGTYKDEARSEDYLEGLAILCDQIPPCILIHSKSLCVTTAL